MHVDLALSLSYVSWLSILQLHFDIYSSLLRDGVSLAHINASGQNVRLGREGVELIKLCPLLKTQEMCDFT